MCVCFARLFQMPVYDLTEWNEGGGWTGAMCSVRQCVDVCYFYRVIFAAAGGAAHQHWGRGRRKKKKSL